MSERFMEYSRRRAIRLIKLQAFVLGLLIIGSAFWQQKQVVLSVSVGSLIFFLPNWIYVLFVNFGKSAWSPEKAVKSIYIGQTLKLALVVGLGVVCIHFLTMERLPFVIGFIASILAHCFTLLFIFQSR